MTESTLPYAAFVAQWLLIVLFVTAAIGKLRHFRRFGRTVGGSLLLFGLRAAPSLTLMVAVTIVTSELTIAFLLAAGVSRWAALAALMLLALFVAVSARAALLGQTIPCNCFGAPGGVLGIETLIRACALAGAAAVVFVGSTLPSWAPDATGDFSSALGLIIGSVLVVAWSTGIRDVRVLRSNRHQIESAATRLIAAHPDSR